MVKGSSDENFESLNLFRQLYRERDRKENRQTQTMHLLPFLSECSVK
jgi:hypothetical protein